MKKILSRNLLIILVSFLLLTCEKDEVTPREYPRVTTHEVSDISSSGAVFHAEITYPGNGPITDHGFVWSTAKGGNLETADRKSLGPRSGKGTFTTTVTYTLEKGATYYVRAYAKGNGYLVYGKEVTFESRGSQAPEIHDFYPKIGTWDDTVKIMGTRFSFIRKNNGINFGDRRSIVLTATDSTITCIVPDSILDKSVKISVTVAGNSSVAENSFQLVQPTVSNFQPAEGTFGDIVTITGSDFRPNSKVRFGVHEAEIVSIHSSEITVQVPAALDQSEVRITVLLNGQEYVTSQVFRLLPPVITRLGSSSELIGNTITIFGNNFSPLQTNNKVFFEDNEAEIVSASANELQVKVPDGKYSQRISKIKVQVAGQSTISNDIFELDNPWYRKKTENESLIEERYWSGIGFATKGYFISHRSFAFLEYDPINNKLKEKTDLPFYKRGRYEVVILPIENTLFYGYFRNVEDYGLFKYDEEQNIWNQTTPYPDGVQLYISFPIGNKGFVGFGLTDKRFWEYDPLESKYTERAYFPGKLGGISFAIDGKGYVGNHHLEFWQYDPAKDQWSSRAPVPSEISESKSIFIYDKKAYAMYHEALYQYDPIEDSWTKIDLPGFPGGSSPFVIGENVYFLSNGQIWELDPHRL